MLRSLKQFYQNNRFLCILELCTLVLVLGTAIAFKQSILQLLPLCISLVIMFLQAQVNRYAFLLGGLNSILYAISYFSMTLYTSAVYALVVSFPLQIITFINWQKRTKGNQTELRRLSKGQLILLIVGCIVAWLFLFAVFSLAGSPYMILDNTSSLLGIVVTVLTMLRFMEYAPLQVISGIVGLILHISVFLDTPSQITYVIYSVYSIICILLAICRMYRTQKAQKEAAPVASDSEA